MSANGTVTIVWAGGEDTFCLAKLGHQLDLEEKCGAGIFEVASRLYSTVFVLQQGMLGGAARVNDVREVIRLGLLGGGMSAEKAMAAVKRHVDEAPLGETVPIAYRVLAAALAGVPGEDAPGKKTEAEGAGPFTGLTDASADQKSSPSASASDGLPASSTTAPYGNSQPPSTDTTAAPTPSLNLP